MGENVKNLPAPIPSVRLVSSLFVGALVLSFSRGVRAERGTGLAVRQEPEQTNTHPSQEVAVNPSAEQGESQWALQEPTLTPKPQRGGMGRALGEYWLGVGIELTLMSLAALFALDSTASDQCAKENNRGLECLPHFSDIRKVVFVPVAVVVAPLVSALAIHALDSGRYSSSLLSILPVYLTGALAMAASWGFWFMVRSGRDDGAAWVLGTLETGLVVPAVQVLVQSFMRKDDLSSRSVSVVPLMLRGGGGLGIMTRF